MDESTFLIRCQSLAMVESRHCQSSLTGCLTQIERTPALADSLKSCVEFWQGEVARSKELEDEINRRLKAVVQ